MNKVLCSTGALIGKPNGRNYRLLTDLSKELACDGFEFMIYSSWYPEFDELISAVLDMKLNIPVIHSQKSLGEALCGIEASFDGSDYIVRELTKEEDEAAYEKGLQELALNIKAAKAFHADRMVLHLWNGVVSDKRIERNIARLGKLMEMTRKEGITLLVENVICNTNDPLYNISLVHKSHPDADFVYDTKMAEFHGQTMKVFEPDYEWLFKEGRVKHLHINDYGGGIKDWSNFDVLPIGKGHVDFKSFFDKLAVYGYKGDFTVEATAFDKTTGVVDTAMLNRCFEELRSFIRNR